MQDTNWKTWGLLFLIAIGVSFELLKTMGGRKGLFESETTVEGQPYSVKRSKLEARNQPVRPQAARTAGQAAGQTVTREMLQKFVAQHTPATTTFEEGKSAEVKDKGAEGAAKKEKAKCNELGQKLDPKTLHPIIDQATGQVAMCKKKKEKAKDEEPVVEAKKEEPRKNNDIDSMVNEAIATGEIPQPFVNDKPDDAFDTAEEWIKRLLNFPDKEETKRFIDHYQRNLVSAEVFYKVTAMMLDDSRSQMKQLGAMCAGLTPSVISFQLLANLIKEERSGSDPRRDAEGFLQRYSDIGNLAILERVMRSSDASFATVLATQKVEAAAQVHLTARPAPPSQTPAQAAVQASALRRNVGYFQKFVGVLTGLLKSPDSSVKDQAGRTLTNLQTLLAGAGSTPTPVPPAGQPPTDGQPTGPVAVQSPDAADGF